MTTIMSQCYGCRHFIPGRPGRCPAFPDGTPIEILINNVDHRKPVPGDNGIRYEAIDPRQPHPLEATQPDEDPPVPLAPQQPRPGMVGSAVIACFFCARPRALAGYHNAVCDSCDRRAKGASGERPWSRYEHTENPVWVDGVQCWRRFVAGSYVTMADPDGCDTLDHFYARHHPKEWAAMARE